MIRISGKTLLVGDIHGSPEHLLYLRERIISHNQGGTIQNVILLGDIGLGFLHDAHEGAEFDMYLHDSSTNGCADPDKEGTYLYDLYAESASLRVTDIVASMQILTANPFVNIYLLRGNHDNSALWNKDDKRHKSLSSRKHVYFLQDGFIKINGKYFLCVGGGISIDFGAQHRLPGRGWWEGEEVQRKEWWNELTPKIKKDFMGILSHTGIRPEGISWKDPDRFKNKNLYVYNGLVAESKYMNELFEKIKPGVWFYGHFHENCLFEKEETVLCCLGEKHTVLLDSRNEIDEFYPILKTHQNRLKTSLEDSRGKTIPDEDKNAEKGPSRPKFGDSDPRRTFWSS